LADDSSGEHSTPHRVDWSILYEWKNLHTVALDDTAKVEFIRKNCLPMAFKRISYMKRRRFASIIEDMTALDSIANSPLVIRLIYPRLSTMPSTASVTLGELLYDLLVERLAAGRNEMTSLLHILCLSRFFRLRRKRPNIWLFWQSGSNWIEDRSRRKRKHC